MKYIMKMKYFRFLYGETGQCFLHFGELQDGMKEETYSFLYLRRVEKHVEQRKSARRLFLFPGHVNLAILGSADEETFRVLKELLRDTEIDTLLVGDEKSAMWDELTGVKEIVRLANGTYQTETAGWNFLIRSFADGTVALAHGLSSDAQDDRFEDCVMSVKALREGTPCQKEASPDGYGCALGCALYQDYDVCRYRGSDGRPAFGTGTLIFGGSEDEETCRELLKKAQAKLGEIRFLGLTAGQARMQAAVAEAVQAEYASASGKDSAGMENCPDVSADGLRRYLVGTEDLGDQAAAKLCRNGWNCRPVILRGGAGVCCSGLLKYSL